MPHYLGPVHGVSFSEAYAEAIAVAPVGRAMVDTLELRHPEFRDDDGNPYAIRIVCDYTDFTATLEDDAPMNAGQAVTFQALPVEVYGPDETDGGETPSVTVAIDGVSGHVLPQLDRAVQTLQPVELTWRVYASDDTSGPAVRPVLTMILRDVNVTETRIEGRATFADPTNRAYPRVEYSAAQYPGLSAA